MERRAKRLLVGVAVVAVSACSAATDDGDTLEVAPVTQAPTTGRTIRSTTTTADAFNPDGLTQPMVDQIVSAVREGCRLAQAGDVAGAKAVGVAALAQLRRRGDVDGDVMGAWLLTWDRHVRQTCPGEFSVFFGA